MFLELFFCRFLNPQYLGTVIYHGRPVCYKDKRLANLALGQSLEHLLFCGLVKRRCHLVKDEYAARAKY